MTDAIKLTLFSPPDFLEAASKTRLHVSPMIYRAGSDMHLYRADVRTCANGGIMYVDSVGFSGTGSCTVLAAEITRECIAAGYKGIMLDFGENTSPLLPLLAEHIHSSAVKNGISLYVPPWLHPQAPKAFVIINTFVASGSLAQHLKKAVSAYGCRKIAADIQCARTQFVPPYGRSPVKRLSPEELRKIISSHNVKSFFSPELCAYYFNFSYNGKPAFVIYDNAASIKNKLALLDSLGIQTAFLFYPEISGFLRDII